MTTLALQLRRVFRRRDRAADGERSLSAVAAVSEAPAVDIAEGEPLPCLRHGRGGRDRPRGPRPLLARGGCTPSGGVRDGGPAASRDDANWARSGIFGAPLAGIKPGEVSLLNITMPGRAPRSTGVLVLYAGDASFTLMTPPGHTFAGWITFNAQSEEGATVVEAHVLKRASDRIFELGLAHRKEDETWWATLRSLAARFGIADAQVTSTVLCDRQRQWRHAPNLQQSSALRTGWYAVKHARARSRPVR